jgi:hypothetical protein
MGCESLATAKAAMDLVFHYCVVPLLTFPTLSQPTYGASAHQVQRVVQHAHFRVVAVILCKTLLVDPEHFDDCVVILNAEYSCAAILAQNVGSFIERRQHLFSVGRRYRQRQALRTESFAEAFNLFEQFY